MANPQIENGHIDIAIEIAEALMQFQLGGYENRVLWAIFRKTYGWHKKEDWISDNQIVKMTGLRKQHVWRAKKQLQAQNIVTKSGYKIAFQKDYTLWKKVTISGIVTKSGIGVTKSGMKVTKNGGHKRNYTKETITKERETHQKIDYLLNIPTEDLPNLKAKLNVDNNDITRKAEELYNYCKAKGKVYKDYRLFLRNALIRDFGYTFKN